MIGEEFDNDVVSQEYDDSVINQEELPTVPPTELLQPNNGQPNTANLFAITAHGESVISFALAPFGMAKQFNKNEAVNLAAWLIVAVGLGNPDFDALTEVTKTVVAIKNT